jgi:hypothetical protein
MLEVVLRASGAVSIDAASAMLRKEWRSLTKVRVVDVTMKPLGQEVSKLSDIAAIKERIDTHGSELE